VLPHGRNVLNKIRANPRSKILNGHGAANAARFGWRNGG